MRVIEHCSSPVKQLSPETCHIPPCILLITISPLPHTSTLQYQHPFSKKRLYVSTFFPTGWRRCLIQWDSMHFRAVPSNFTAQMFVLKKKKNHFPRPWTFSWHLYLWIYRHLSEQEISDEKITDDMLMCSFCRSISGCKTSIQLTFQIWGQNVAVDGRRTY